VASGEALRARYGKPAEQLDDQAAWALEARYLAIGIMNAVLMVSPERVVLGGGVLKKPGLLPIVRTQVKELMSGYSEVGNIDRFIVPLALGDHAGVLAASTPPGNGSTPRIGEMKIFGHRRREANDVAWSLDGVSSSRRVDACPGCEYDGETTTLSMRERES
jgi:hypothetical protein